MPYYTNCQTKNSIDAILHQIAILFANCSDDNREEVKLKEKQMLAEISKLDLEFAERCGYNQDW